MRKIKSLSDKLMSRLVRSILMLMCFVLTGAAANAQQAGANDSLRKTDLVISYEMKIDNGQRKAGIGDVYDGGSKTIFLSGRKARIRLVSLMRIESIYFMPVGDSSYKITKVRETLKKPEKKQLSPEEWRAMNEKYDSSRFANEGDSMTILEHKCYKAVVNLADGRKLDVYYTKDLPKMNAFFEPAFASVPGAVLQYSYAHKSGTLTYTAVSIRKTPINPTVFNENARQLDKISL